MYPPETNAEFDCMDKNGTLKNLTSVMEEMELLEQDNALNDGSIGEKSDSGIGSRNIQHRLPQSIESLSPAQQAAHNAQNSFPASDHSPNSSNKQETVPVGRQMLLIVEDEQTIMNAI